MLNGRTELHISTEAHLPEIVTVMKLSSPTNLFGGAMGSYFVFMDDDARTHRPHAVDDLLESEDICRTRLASSDLNSIERVWDIWGRRLVA